MIGYLKGKVISLKPTQILLDVNSVGYMVNISLNTYEKVSNVEFVSLYIYTSVKEDSISLFGFQTLAEKEMFELLISINGIGPKLALGVLSGIQVSVLKKAIASSDISRIIAIPGIGKKTAERLLLELKSKVDNVSGEDVDSGYLKIRNESVSALTTLGYNAKTAEKIVFDILSKEPQITLEDLIKKALINLGK